MIVLEWVWTISHCGFVRGTKVWLQIISMLVISWSWWSMRSDTYTGREWVGLVSCLLRVKNETKDKREVVSGGRNSTRGKNLQELLWSIFLFRVSRAFDAIYHFDRASWSKHWNTLQQLVPPFGWWSLFRDLSFCLSNCRSGIPALPS